MLQLIDYSRIDQRGAARPQVSEGKFVQLLHNDNEVLCFARRQQSAFHAHIVARYCREHGLSFELKSPDSTCVPQVELLVQGGGHFFWDALGLTLKMFGRSMAYGPFLRPGLRDRLAALPQLAGYTILVEPH